MSLTSLRKQILEIQLSFLWDCWSSIGVSGYQSDNTPFIIDPEALLVYTLNIGRYDNRLYDEVFDWCKVNGQFLSIPRLKKLIKNSDDIIVKQVGVLAEILSKKSSHKKWSVLRDPGKSPENSEYLFFLKEGNELPLVGTRDSLFLEYGLERDSLTLRGYSQPFNPSHPSVLLLKLRTLMGGTSRCEIIVSLLSGEEKNPSLLARETGYSQKIIQDTIVEMTWSGVITSRQSGREKLYRLTPEFRESIKPSVDVFFPHWVETMPLCVKLWSIVEGTYKKGLPSTTMILLLNKELEKSNSDIILQDEPMVIDTFNKLLRNAI